MNLVKLYAPDSYINATENVRNMVVNGCGAGGWKIDLVPDHLLGISIREACKIHDWMYALGETIADKEEADRVFLNNMLRIINAYKSNWILQHFRRRLAHGYYEAVEHFGGPAFWTGKNGKNNLIEICV